jgi:hypothetical protein
MSVTRLLFVAILMLAAGGQALAQPHVVPEIQLRAGYFGSWGDGRDGLPHELHTAQARLLLGGSWRPSAEWTIQARLATRLSTEQDGWRLRDPLDLPGPDGMPPGQTTLDRLALTWQPAPEWQLRAGRFQVGFPLPDVTAKSLQRNDGVNLDVHWLDGLHARYDAPGVGRIEAVAAYHPAPGTASAFRAPLALGRDGASRAAFWGALSGRQPIGPLTHRALQATLLPAAAPDPAGGFRTYAAVSAQAALTFPLEDGRFVIAGEGGWTPTPPAGSVLRVEDHEAGRLAGTASVNLVGFGGGALDAALAVSRTDPAWLLSPDIRPNNREIELRTYWRFAPRMRLDARIRRRQDAAPPAGAVRGRDDWDVYVRLNVRL